MSSCFDSFSFELIQGDDPEVQRYLALPEEEKQSSFDATIQLLPGSDKLEIEPMEGLRNWLDFQLTVDDFKSLEGLGLKGTLRATGWGTSGERPFKSRTLIVAQHQISEPIDLPQPNNCEVIYYQVGDEWRKFPEAAPVLKKRFRLMVDPFNPNLTLMWAEAYFDSTAGGGGGAFTWDCDST